MDTNMFGATVRLQTRTDGVDVVSDRLRNALDMVDTMTANGLTAVPVKPTADMLLAGARAGGVSVEQVWSIYMAMLRAMDAG